MAKELARNYETCRRIHNRHGRIFSYSSRFFSKATRQGLDALYAFARVSREMVDNPPAGSDATENLSAFRGATLLALRHGQSTMPVLSAFSDTAKRWGIRPELPLAYLDALAADARISRFETFEELAAHTETMSSLVAVMACAILKIVDDAGVECARQMALAIQLTEYWRDIGEDWQQRRRVALPQEDMRQFGYTEAMLANREVNDAFRQLMRHEMVLTRTLYASADAGLGRLPSGVEMPVRLARTLFGRILDKIEKSGCDVFGNRPTTSDLESAAALLRLRFRTA